MHRITSTASVEASQHLCFWTGMVGDTYVQLECDAHAGSGLIEGEIASDRPALLELSRVSATALRVRRAAARISRASEDFFLVSIQTEGRGVVSQDDHDAVLAPGGFACTTALGPIR